MHLSAYNSADGLVGPNRMHVVHGGSAIKEMTRSVLGLGFLKKKNQLDEIGMYKD